MQSVMHLCWRNRFLYFWAILQSIHFIWAITTRETRPVRLGDPLMWYVEYNWLFVGFGGLLLVILLAKTLNPATLQDSSFVKPLTARECLRIHEMLEGILIFDSNIWMNPLLDQFFQQLQNAVCDGHHILTLFGPQFDEICNIKDRAPYSSKRGRLARLALTRIERMQRSGCLRIDQLVLQAHPKAYADPKILSLIGGLITDGQAVHFVSDDRELRIRARQIADQKMGSLTICTSKCLLTNNPH